MIYKEVYETQVTKVILKQQSIFCSGSMLMMCTMHLIVVILYVHTIYTVVPHMIVYYTIMCGTTVYIVCTYSMTTIYTIMCGTTVYIVCTYSMTTIRCIVRSISMTIMCMCMGLLLLYIVYDYNQALCMHGIWDIQSCILSHLYTSYYCYSNYCHTSRHCHTVTLVTTVTIVTLVTTVIPSH